MIWTDGWKGYGHIAIYGGGNKYYHQNWNGEYVEVLNQAYTGGFSINLDGYWYANYWGVIRPKFSDTSSSSSITYTNIAEGTYYIKNNSNGEYMSVSYGADNQGQNVNTYPFGTTSEFSMILTKASSGYKIRPGCCASRLINAYGSTVQSGNNVNIWDDWNESSQWWGFEKVSGGYVIRNMMNPSCVLSLDSGRDIIVSTYTGAASQIWTIQNYVTYNANGGSGAPSAQLKNYSSTLTLRTTKPTRSGYIFQGWSTGASATTASYAAGGSYTSNKNVTLYAVWHKHSPGAAATCTTAQKCTTCGATLTSAKGHKAGSAATCTTAQKCTACGITLVSAKGHTPGTSATCTSAQKCTTCGITLVSAKGHAPGSAATCTSPQKCKVCGVTLTAAKGHKAGTAATCTSPQKCTACGVTLASAKGHTFGAAATCTTAQKCTVCGITVNPVGGHHPGAEATCTSPQTCTICGVTITEKKAHSPGGTATCMTDQTCLECGEILQSATGHSPGNRTVTSDGGSEILCTVCNVQLEYEMNAGNIPEEPIQDSDQIDQVTPSDTNHEDTEELPETTSENTEDNDRRETKQSTKNVLYFIVTALIGLSLAAIFGFIVIVTKKRK